MKPQLTLELNSRNNSSRMTRMKTTKTRRTQQQVAKKVKTPTMQELTAKVETALQTLGQILEREKREVRRLEEMHPANPTEQNVMLAVTYLKEAAEVMHQLKDQTKENWSRTMLEKEMYAQLLEKEEGVRCLMDAAMIKLLWNKSQTSPQPTPLTE